MPTKKSDDPSSGNGADEPEMVNLSLMPTGDLIEAFWHGMNRRQAIMTQLEVAKHAMAQQPGLAADIRVQSEFKEAQKNLLAARDGCNTIKSEINVRFASTDAMRFAMAEGEALKQ